MKYTRADFPKDFLFGVATSAYQIEGHAQGGAGPTHWDSFAATPGNVVRAENGDLACDHLHRYEQDFDLIREAGFDCYRFSTSWARVLPEGRGPVNQAGLDYYDRLADALLERGIRPCATLYHWELPSALADLGGWRNRDIANWFADFTEIIMRRIGDRMYSVAPINEPWCVSWLSHFEGHHAPGLRDIRATARAMHHVLLAHGRAIQAMRGLGMSNLGAVFNLEWAEPADDTPEARAAADLYDGIYNRFFLGGVFNKAYPENVLQGLQAHLPDGWQDDFDTIGTPVDWCGLNYYTRKLIAPADTPWPSLQEVPGPLPKTQMGWEIEPSALTRFLTRTARDYTGDLPIYVTENGMASPERQQDDDRIDYLNQHLAAVQDALDQGVPVKGYFIWSLLDNYEWALGYEKRFGLVDVDFDTLERRPKASFRAMQAALAQGDPVSVPMAQPRGAMRDHWNLVADIGGTNTRLGVVTDGTLTDLRKFPTGTLPEFLAALHDLCAEIGTPPRAVVAAGAGPVRNGTIRLTNANLDLSEAAIATATGADHTFVINDFTAAAWSVAEITGDDVQALQGDPTPPKGTRLVVGPGTGLGVGALLYSEGHYHTVSGEGGHVGLSPRTRDEVDVFEAARRIAPECFFGNSLTLEAEMFLSGTGLPILYRAVGMAAGQPDTPVLPAKDILQAARDGSDPLAARAAQIFTTHLGAVMGDMAVTVMPTGGVFLVGGVAEKNRWLFGDDFLAAFNAGGRFDALRQGFGVYVSEQAEFGIVGANNFCKNALAR
ncbi:beta-glucosidase A [Ruegeria lacuscaerulensis ITI-1157]|nr:beta-glucosidase A [Ruegeria lacuscaerulensis ITI-1157]SHJ76986.1 glucokinase/beta-galactosidase,TIGR03356 [Ruegeria lacuscaerulensis ITI-1157]